MICLLSSISSLARSRAKPATKIGNVPTTRTTSQYFYTVRGRRHRIRIRTDRTTHSSQAWGTVSRTQKPKRSPPPPGLKAKRHTGFGVGCTAYRLRAASAQTTTTTIRRWHCRSVPCGVRRRSHTPLARHRPGSAPRRADTTRVERQDDVWLIGHRVVPSGRMALMSAARDCGKIFSPKYTGCVVASTGVVFQPPAACSALA